MPTRRAWIARALVVPALLLSACGGGDEVPPAETSDAESEEPAPVCGNGVKEGFEQCDDGNATNADGCEIDCTVTCRPGTGEGDKKCNDGNPCNGVETCGEGNKCVRGPSLADGSACGAGKMCRVGACVEITCGDGVVTTPEECDDANVTAGDGCDLCRFTCTTTDPARNCRSTEACREDGLCDDARHTCTSGSPKADGTACGSAMLCRGGACVGARCGDGVLSPGEECDFGSGNGAGTGCELDCRTSCRTTPTDTCDDGDPCDGTETCAPVTVAGMTGRKCSAGTPRADGTSCGSGLICRASVCVAGRCGDGIVSGTEQCDLGLANGPGAGCEVDCRFSCTTSPDSCVDSEPCNGAESCVAAIVAGGAAQQCRAGSPLADGAVCGVGKVCRSGACVAPPPITCGDGRVDSGEECDFGTENGAGRGCEPTCRFSCSKTADTCSDGDPCNGVESCESVTVSGRSGQRCGATAPLADCTVCGSGGVCQGGRCRSSTCGDGCVDATSGEQCDFGTGNAPGSGCEPVLCRFSCTKSPDSCLDSNACNGVEQCDTVTAFGRVGQRCSAGSTTAKCSTCAAGLCNGTGTCLGSTCGDGCVDSSRGEQCEPPSTATCDASCRAIVPPVCGNGKRELGEQCDDANTRNLDGCDAVCRFEQDHRANSLTMQFATDSFCTANALGGAIASAAQNDVREALASGVTDGSTNILFKFLGLDDLSGTTDAAVTLGSLDGDPFAPPSGVTYSGANDLDWWYRADPLTIDGARDPLPTARINGRISAKVLTAGPGNMAILVRFSSSMVSPIALSNVLVSSTIGATNKPLSSTGTTPGHLASENLDPALVTFATMGTSASPGQLCGNVSAHSLSRVPIPTALTTGVTRCAEGYTAANSLLDVIVGGCTGPFFVRLINRTQPDKEDPSAAAAGAGPTYMLSAADVTTKVVDRCRDRAGATFSVGSAPFDACLRDAAYSSYFKFTTDRVIVK